MKRVLYIVGLSYRSFLEVYKFDKRTVTLIIAISVFSSLKTYFDIYLSKVIVDNIFGGDHQILYYALLALVVFKLLSSYFTAASSAKTARLTYKFNNKCDEELIDKIEGMELIAKEHPRFNADFPYLKYSKNQTYSLYLQFTQLIFKMLTLFIGLKYLFEIDTIFCFLAVLFGLLKGLLDLKPTKIRAKLNEDVQKKAVKYVYFYELLTSIRHQKELILYNAFNYFKQQWRRKKEEYDEIQMALVNVNNKVFIQQEGISIFFEALIIILFAYLISGESFTIGSYISLTMAVNITMFNFSSLIHEYAQMSENYVHYERVNQDSYYSNTYNKIKNEGNREFKINHNIIVSNLNFTYPNTENQALKEINLLINKGETVVILGDNGSGKSTLVKVLVGLYRTNIDSVFVDGISMKEFKSDSISEKCSVVFQDFIQYQTTIRDNIGIGDINNIENESRMNKVLKHVDIKMNNYKLETKVGLVYENAINLSGGQWQRLALSRFYFKENPEMAVFDEVTSALDPLTEVRLFNDIISYCKDITTIIISHRVGVAKKADKIIVMENGRIIEQGNHKQLLDNNGKYTEMWLSQKEWYQEEKEGEIIHG